MVAVRLRRCLSVAGLLAGVLLGCGQGALTLEDALRVQPAGLVDAPEQFAVGDGVESACGGEFTQAVTAIDLSSGEIRWELPTPWGPGPVAIMGGLAIAVGHVVDGYPPSVVATDLDTGRPVWQRFLDQPTAALLAESDMDQVAIRSGLSLLVVNPDGSVRTVETPGERFSPVGPLRPGELVGWSALDGRTGMVDPFTGDQVDGKPGGINNGGIQSIRDDWLVAAEASKVAAVHLATGRQWERALPVDDEFSRVVRIVAGDPTLVLLGSNLGPNRRLVVLDVLTGELLWTLDGVRNAAAGDGDVLYDRRNTNVDDPTRDVFVVDADDPNTVRWSTASSGELGGYIGTNESGHVFVVRSESGPAQLTPLPRSATPPALLDRAPQPTPSVSLVTDDLAAVAVGAGVLYRRPTGPQTSVQIDQPITGLRRHENLLIVTSGRGSVGCH